VRHGREPRANDRAVQTRGPGRAGSAAADRAGADRNAPGGCGGCRPQGGVRPGPRADGPGARGSICGTAAHARRAARGSAAARARAMRCKSSSRTMGTGARERRESLRTGEPENPRTMITVYGADWCEDTQRSMRHLRRLGVPYRYINIDEDLDALARAKALNS